MWFGLKRQWTHPLLEGIWGNSYSTELHWRSTFGCCAQNTITFRREPSLQCTLSCAMPLLLNNFEMNQPFPRRRLNPQHDLFLTFDLLDVCVSFVPARGADRRTSLTGDLCTPRLMCCLTLSGARWPSQNIKRPPGKVSALMVTAVRLMTWHSSRTPLVDHLLSNAVVYWQRLY